MDSEPYKGQVINTVQAGLIKATKDGVTVGVVIDEDQTPNGLELTFNWPRAIPDKKIDFILIATNEGDSFLSAFYYTSWGLAMAYSEHSNPRLDLYIWIGCYLFILVW